MAPQRDWFDKDFYAVLGVSPTATQKEISKAYKKLAVQYHPDKNQGDAAAEERFKAISAAYDVVGDESKRAEYDEARRLGPAMGGGFPGNGTGSTFRFEGGDLGDLLGNLFGGRRGRGGTGASPTRGDDVDARLTLSFLDAIHGITTTLQVVSDAVCSTCDGSGARPGTSPRVCSTCGGRGVIDDNQGFFSFSKPCDTCGGRGSVVDQPCPTCAGRGIERRPREVKVRIPAGVDDGQKIRLKGRGAPGRNGGPAGDLIVTCNVQPHAFFGRDGANLTLTVPVTFAEAALGHEVDVPLLDGGSVKLRLAPGTQTGSRQRVKGKGVATSKSTGDLVVTWSVAVPTKLSAAERKAIEELARVTHASPRAHLEVGSR